MAAEQADAGADTGVSGAAQSPAWLRWLPLTLRTPRAQRWGAHALVALVYVLLTLVMLWPLPRHAGSAVQDVGDPLFEVWVMRNVQHRLVHDPLDLYDANAFYPFETTLAFSEEAIATAVLAWPVQLLTGDAILAYNAMVLGSFWLLAFAVYLLARELGAVRGAAFVAGLLAAFAPARYGELSHLHMLVLGWAPLVLWALLRALRTRDARWLLPMSVFLTIQLLSSLHLAVFTTLLLGLSAPFLLWLAREPATDDGPTAWWRLHGIWPSRRWLAMAAVALLVPYLLLAPTLQPHLAVADRWGFERTPQEIASLAVQPGDFLAVYTHQQFLDERLGMAASYTPLFPGIVATLGALLAVVLARRRTVVVLWLLLVALVSGVFALGLEFTLAGRTWSGPYRLLYDHIGPLQSVRAVGRYGLLFAIAVPLLAACGLSAVWERLLPLLRRRALPVAACGVALTLLVSVAALVELRAPAGAAPAADAAQMAIYDWLAQQASGPVLELPADGLTQSTSAPQPLQGLFQPITQMYGATRHWNPTVAGYSGFIPPPYFALIEQFRTTAEQPAAINAGNIGLVQQLGIRWLIVHRMAGMDVEATLAAADALPQLQRVHDSGQAVVYAVAPQEPLALTLSLNGGASGVLAYSADGDMTAPAADVAVLDVALDAGTAGRPGFLWLAQPTELRYAWRSAEGVTALEGALPQQPPVVAPSGLWRVTVGIPTPDVPGTYRVTVGGRQGIHGEQELLAEQVVTVGPPLADAAAPVFAVERVERTTPQRPFTVAVAITLRALVDPPWDVSATLQLLDASGTRVFGEDVTPVGGLPPTSAMVAGETLTVTMHLPEKAFAAADARLLLAVYLPTSDYRRVPLQLPDDSVAHEYIVLPLALP